ncbi:hypothetical protein HYS31_08530 [Candidatus Woesearchaeota archaeon]|nr:hypothetical protein [Candidatus Woesearchaeota archaeon]
MERCMSGFKAPSEGKGPGRKYRSAEWECYDGVNEVKGESSCKTYEEWTSVARSSCDGHCSKESGKCGVNSFSISDECREEKKCPEYPAPNCQQGQRPVSRKDSNGCLIYDCPTEQACPQISKPACKSDEKLETYYDNKGCATSYQCIKYSTCPAAEKPACAESQSLTAKYDDKGCVTYECVAIPRSNESGSGSFITGSVAGDAFDEQKRHCEQSWMRQESMCSNIGSCEKSSFIEKCKEQEKKNYDEHISRIGQQCSSSIGSEIKHAEQRCARLEEDRKGCMEQGSKRCSQMKGLAQQCKEFMTEERIRSFIVEESKKKCKFRDIIEDEDDIKGADKKEIVLAVLNTATHDDIIKLELFVDGLKEELKLQDTAVYKGMIDPSVFKDIKLLPFVVNAKLSSVASSEKAKETKEGIVARQKAEEAAAKLASLRDSGLPNEYLYIIEDKASEVLDVSGELGEIEKKDEEKGVGYKIKLFFGLAKKAEELEIKQLQESNDKLKNSIETLSRLIDEVPNDVAKAILKEQVENLENQQEEINALIQTKEKKSKGLFGIFG